MDHSKKTMRHFYCRDVLWETFEQMANDFDCSIDYLVNEAMRHYARTKNYQAAGGAPPPSSNPPRPATRSANPQAPLAPPAAPAAPAAPRRPPGPTPAAAGFGPQGSPVRAPSLEGSPAGGNGTLYLMYDGQRYPVTKDQFIIGRGTKTSDLAIKDGNISRKHAAVIRRNGTFYIKDLGSTNGIDYKGMRIDNKRIDEGDIFHLCDYELRFTYRQE